jgi:hypothetical protein
MSDRVADWLAGDDGIEGEASIIDAIGISLKENQRLGGTLHFIAEM